MRRILVALLCSAVLALVATVTYGRVQPALDARWETAGAANGTTFAQRLGRGETVPLLFVPDSVTREPSGPVTLVLVLPGLGGVGRGLAQAFVPAAEEHRWLLLAPSPNYDPILGNESLSAADLRVDESLMALVDEVIGTSRFRVAAAIDVVGFSRGAQSAHRFALRHPDRVAALASFSAGTYTMPTSPEPYPYGIGNFALLNHQHSFDAAALAHVRVLVGVGEADANPADVVREWDAVGGTTRLERGKRFAQALVQLGVPTRFRTYAGVGHAFSPGMRDDAIGWFGA
jgi:pimeloyl-ACP methyl ester carboxylesterase